MSNEKSFLDDNGLQRLWQKITAAINESGNTVKSFLVGDIKASLNENQSSNWLKCDGNPVRISDYQELCRNVKLPIYIYNSQNNLPDSSSFYSSQNNTYLYNEIYRYNNACYYPIIDADQNSFSIIRIKDRESLAEKITTISLPNSAKIYRMSNIIRCWNAYNIVLFSDTSVKNNTVTLTYYIAKAETPEVLTWAISGPYTLNLHTENNENMTPAIYVSSDENNLIFSVSYGSAGNSYVDLGVIPHSISSARLIHLFGPIDRIHHLIVEHIGDRYFLNEVSNPVCDPSPTIENKIPFFRDINSISVEYLNLPLPLPYQLSAFSYYGFEGVLKVGDKFRAYLSTREDVSDGSSTKYITSIYMYESSNPDFTNYTIKTIYRNIATSTPSWDYLVDDGTSIFVVGNYNSYIQIYLVDKDDPTKLKDGKLYSFSSYSNRLDLWNNYKPIVGAHNEYTANADRLLYFGSTNDRHLGIFRLSVSDPDYIVALPKISKDTQGYRYIKAK